MPLPHETYLFLLMNQTRVQACLLLVLVSQSENLSSSLCVDPGFVGITGTYEQNPKIFYESVQAEKAKDERPYPVGSTYSKASHQLSPKWYTNTLVYRPATMKPNLPTKPSKTNFKIKISDRFCGLSWMS